MTNHTQSTPPAQPVNLCKRPALSRILMAVHLYATIAYGLIIASYLLAHLGVTLLNAIFPSLPCLPSPLSGEGLGVGSSGAVS